MNNTKIGFGFDTHKFIATQSVDEEYIILCNIKIPYKMKFCAHSDGDAALHAITDALLGAMGEDDIGMFFPPTQDEWKDMESTYFLEFANKLLMERGGSIHNIDVTIVTQEPKLMSYKDMMRKRVAEILKIVNNQVTIKAKTSENMGFIGRCEGLSVYAVCLITLPTKGANHESSL